MTGHQARSIDFFFAKINREHKEIARGPEIPKNPKNVQKCTIGAQNKQIYASCAKIRKHVQTCTQMYKHIQNCTIGVLESDRAIDARKPV